MSNPCSQHDVLLLLRLIVAHVIADFLLQKYSWVNHRLEKQWASGWLYLHGAITGVLAYIFAGIWNVVWLPFIIFISHAALDGLKSKGKDTARYFLLDQLGHLIAIFVCWILLINVNILDFVTLLTAKTSNVRFWTVTLSYIIVIWPAGIWIGKATEPWRKEIKGGSYQGLEKAGLWIGCLERILILTFVLLHHFEAVGFLIAAKSFFRFGELRTPDCRKEADYILIGSMFSFGIAIVLGIFTSWVMEYSLILIKL